MKKVMSWILTLVLMLTVIPSNLLVAHAAGSSGTQYAYVVLAGDSYTRRLSNGNLWVQGSWGEAGEYRPASDGSYTIDFEFEVTAAGEISMSGTKWTNESFRCDQVYRTGNITPKSNRFLAVNPAGSGSTRFDSLQESLDHVLRGFEELNVSDISSLTHSADGKSVAFTGKFRVTRDDYNSMPVNTLVTRPFVTILEYASENILEDDEGSIGWVPEPPKFSSVPKLHDEVVARPAYINYRTYAGTVSAEGSITDTSEYKDKDFLDYYKITLNAFGKQSSKTGTTQLGKATTSLIGDIAKNASWLREVYEENILLLEYTASIDAYLQLQSGNNVSAGKSTVGKIGLLNALPTVTFNLKTNDFNGKPVLPDYFYVNVPARINVTFSDTENDIQESYLNMGLKADIDAGKAHFAYNIKHTGEEEYFVSTSLIDVKDVVKNINGYSATITFKQPGLYGYSQFVVDAASDPRLTQVVNGKGTFLVREEPKAPVAIINDIAYAFDGETQSITQKSTDPNGVDDIVYYNWSSIVDVTQEHDPIAAADKNFKPITNITANWTGNGTVNGKNGGTITFPAGSAHHYFKVKLDIRDSTGLTSSTEKVIKVISKAPVASLVADTNTSGIKENRKIVLSAEGSTSDPTDPILWNECIWTIEALSGGTTANIHEDTSQRNGNKRRALQFDKAGTYKVTLNVVNKFSKNNQGHADLAASKVSTIITVIEDKPPISSISITSGKPNLSDNITSYTVRFRTNSASIDGDIIKPNSYNWVIYEDKNNDGTYTSDEIVPQNRITYNAERTEAAVISNYTQGKIIKLQAVVTTTETFKEAFIEKLLPLDGSHVRKVTVSIIEELNWKPRVEILPNSNVKTPYEDADIDGDSITDGKFIRAYTDDIFSVNNKIVDEFPDKCQVSWELSKKEHNGAFNNSSGGTPWLSSSNVTNTLTRDGGTLKINSPGIYRLKMIVKDTQGETAEHSVMMRIYTLPIAVLETNPTYQINSGNPWYTKENIRFDLRSNPTIVDDEWGKAWHTMNWDLDNWDVKTLSGQNSNEIHFMNPQYTARYNNVFPNDESKFSGRKSPLGFGVVVDRPIDIVVMPGLLGRPKEDNNLQLDDTERQQMYAAADALATKLGAKDKRYNTKVYKTWAAQDTNDLFRTPEMYGFFDPFTNTGDDEKNMYTKSYKSEITDTSKNTGTNVVIADLNKMNTDNCKFGVIDLMTAYDEKHPEVADIEFTGAAKVYVNGTLISDCPNKSTWKNVASLEALPDGTWKIQGNLGVSVICSGDTEVKTAFTGGTLWTSVATRGWGGIYNDEYKMVTHEKTILETLKTLNLRSNATKIIIYSANMYGEKVELRPGVNVATDDKCQALGDYLNANQMHFMAVVPNGLSKQMNDLYKKLAVNGVPSGKWVPYGVGTTEFIGNDLYNYILSKATLVDNTQYRSCTFTAPGRYEITYWGTNYGGKVTKPVTYQIEVEPDIAPIISGDVAEKLLRDPNDSYNRKYRATIALTGPYSDRLKRDVLTITSPDGDHIDHTTVDVIWDANNNKVFTDGTDKKWKLTESTGTQLSDLYYVLKKLKAS